MANCSVTALVHRHVVVTHEAAVPGFAARAHVSIGCIIAGEARSFARQAVWSSQKQHLFEPLRKLGALQIVAVLSPEDETPVIAGVLQKLGVSEAAYVRSSYEKQSLRLVVGFTLLQKRMPLAAMDWLIRLRPDHLLLQAVFGIASLTSLDAQAVHAPIRCQAVAGHTFHEDHYEPALHLFIRQLCGRGNGTCSSCAFLGCRPCEFRLVDQFALVPRLTIAAYQTAVSESVCALNERLSLALPPPGVKTSASGPCLTDRLLRQGLDLRPFSFPGILARTVARQGMAAVASRHVRQRSIPDGEGGHLFIDDGVPWPFPEPSSPRRLYACP